MSLSRGTEWVEREREGNFFQLTQQPLVGIWGWWGWWGLALSPKDVLGVSVFMKPDFRASIVATETYKSNLDAGSCAVPPCASPNRDIHIVLFK